MQRLTLEYAKKKIASLLGSNTQMNTATPYVWGFFLDVYLTET